MEAGPEDVALVRGRVGVGGAPENTSGRGPLSLVGAPINAAVLKLASIVPKTIKVHMSSGYLWFKTNRPLNFVY